MPPLPTEIDYSTSPSGERFPIPAEADYAQEFARVEALANQARAEGKEVVVVMGLGFVGGSSVVA
jgi:UDP-N-acetyl-D-glucosamine dehydrogenase